jgi:hypothetical protein
METLLDLDALSIEEAAGHLQAVENRRRKKTVAPAQDAGGQLLLTEEQWKARCKTSSGEKSGGRGSGGSGSGGGRGGGRGRGRGGGRGDAQTDSREKREDRGGSDRPSEKCCFCCGKPGHFARECRSKKKVGQAHLAQEEESTLMLIERGDFQFETTSREGGDISNPTALLSVTTPAMAAGVLGLSTATPSPVHLLEEKVFTHFSDEVKKESKRWVLDSGASNHMTGVRDAFAELDSNIRDTIKFGDGSVVEIEGVGTVIFICKNGEHRSLTGVYLIPKLTTNIVSLGQLDEIGYEIVIKGGVMRVRDEQMKLLAKVQRAPNRLYVLNMEVVQPVSLVARETECAWLWHTRFGHLNFRALRNLARGEMVRSLLEIEHVE